MILELHIIQNFAPSNLNRDDTNTPKDCVFGGHRRARISSQCMKRSIRRHPAFADTVKRCGGHIGVRTKRLKARLTQLFVEKHGKEPQAAARVARTLIGLLGLRLRGTEKTEYLLYLGENELDEMEQIAVHAWDRILSCVDTEEAETEGGLKSRNKKKRRKKEEPQELQAVEAELNAVVGRARKKARSYAADIALFGRMVADRKNMNVDAACQVAHAFSTNRVEMEMDYYTAVDDLLPDDETGSDMIGVVEFNSACFYRYANIHLDQLRQNLGYNDDLLTGTVLGFVEATLKAVPSGKQNSSAAQNPAGYARVIVRRDGFPWSLANAFQQPIKASGEASLEEHSIAALEDYFARLRKVYGGDGIICDSEFNVHKQEGSLEAILQAIATTLAEVSRQ